MEILYPRCAGLDVHKHTVVACVREVQQERVTQQTRTFKTHTAGLLELAQWLKSCGVHDVAMEATGVYWKPLWHVLEADFELVLANAAHVKNVPGRKTDVNDAMWLADLLAHGLIQPSFVPPAPVQELRTLTRTRKQFVRDRAAQVQRLDKILEDANVKLSTVVSDLTGKSGRAVIQALIDGGNDPQRLLAHISPRVKASREELLYALHGRVNAHHRFLLNLHLQQIDAIDRAIAQIDQEAGEKPEPFRHAVALLSTMPGLSEVSAQVLIAEIGLDMSRFASAGHLRSWACLCPRNDESAGKRRSTRLRSGGQWLKTTLVQVAWAAVRVKGGYLQAQFHRLRARRGVKKAIVAVAASMLSAAWYMLKNDTPWQDLGGAYFDRADATKTANRLLHRLQQIGYRVTLEATPSS